MAKLLKSFEYGKAPNTYDLLKAIALLTMVIDHIGFYFFPDQTWLRVIGRIAFPTFLFLVGYSGSFRFNGWLLLGATLVTGSALLVGFPIPPYNILFTILICRVFMGILSQRPKVLNELGILWVALTIFYPLTYMLIEYGTIALMFCLLGWLTRQERNDELPVRLCWLYTLVFSIIMQQIDFGFGIEQLVGYIALTAVMGIGLMQFKLEPFHIPANHTDISPTRQEKLVILAARNTLVIYVVHVILFHWITRALTPERFGEGFLRFF